MIATSYTATIGFTEHNSAGARARARSQATVAAAAAVSYGARVDRGGDCGSGPSPPVRERQRTSRRPSSIRAVAARRGARIDRSVAGWLLPRRLNSGSERERAFVPRREMERDREKNAETYNNVRTNASSRVAQSHECVCPGKNCETE